MPSILPICLRTQETWEASASNDESRFCSLFAPPHSGGGENLPKGRRYHRRGGVKNRARREALIAARKAAADASALVAERFLVGRCANAHRGCAFGPWWCMFAHSEADRRTVEENIAEGLTTMAAIDTFRKTQYDAALASAMASKDPELQKEILQHGEKPRGLIAANTLALMANSVAPSTNPAPKDDTASNSNNSPNHCDAGSPPQPADDNAIVPSTPFLPPSAMPLKVRVGVKVCPPLSVPAAAPVGYHQQERVNSKVPPRKLSSPPASAHAFASSSLDSHPSALSAAEGVAISSVHGMMPHTMMAAPRVGGDDGFGSALRAKCISHAAHNDHQWGVLPLSISMSEELLLAGHGEKNVRVNNDLGAHTGSCGGQSTNTQHHSSVRTHPCPSSGGGSFAGSAETCDKALTMASDTAPSLPSRPHPTLMPQLATPGALASTLCPIPSPLPPSALLHTGHLTAPNLYSHHHPALTATPFMYAPHGTTHHLVGGQSMMPQQMYGAAPMMHTAHGPSQMPFGDALPGFPYAGTPSPAAAYAPYGHPSAFSQPQSALPRDIALAAEALQQALLRVLGKPLDTYGN